MENLPSRIKWSALEYEFHEKTPGMVLGARDNHRRSRFSGRYLHNFYSPSWSSWPDFPSDFMEPEDRG